jgi:hypothetical protein
MDMVDLGHDDLFVAVSEVGDKKGPVGSRNGTCACSHALAVTVSSALNSRGRDGYVCAGVEAPISTLCEDCGVSHLWAAAGPGKLQRMLPKLRNRCV